MRIAVLWLLAGCGVFQCDEGESRCNADGIATCNAYGEWEISLCCAQDGCREVDVDGTSSAVCTPVAAPDPRCEGADPIDSICTGDNSSLVCDHGYGGFEHACAGVCVSPEAHHAFCALAAEPDPRCPATGITERCAGDRIVHCFDGFATAETLCEAPFSECILAPGNLGHHPVCATAILGCSGEAPGRCDGNDVVGCRGTQQTIEHCEFGCYENPIDSMFPEAFCDSEPCSIGF